MKIVVFGASGKLGKPILFKALEQGHEVTAFSRNSKDIPINHKHLRIQVGDIYQPEAIIKAIANQDAVISVLGRKGTNAPMICRDGIRAILPAMEQHGVERLIAVSTFGAAEDRSYSTYTRLLRLLVGKNMQDKDEMESLIKASQTFWTIIRPAFLKDTAPPGYQLIDRVPGLFPTVRREAVADCIMDRLKLDDCIRQTVAVRGV